MVDLIAALGLAIALEGAAYALFPEGMKRLTTQMLAQPAGSLRTAGTVAAVIGVGLVWLARG